MIQVAVVDVGILAAKFKNIRLECTKAQLIFALLSYWLTLHLTTLN